MDEGTQGQIILKRNKFGTFLNLFFFVIIFLFMVLIVRGGDYEVFLPPYENLDAMLGISFSLIVLTCGIVIFSLQLIKKGTIIANENGIIDNYSTSFKGEIYPREDIISIDYMWRGISSKSAQKKLVLLLSSGKTKTFILPTLTRMSFDLCDIKRVVAHYYKNNGRNILINDFTKPRGIGEIIIRNFGG